MYAVYTACMEYGNARKDQESAEKALRSQVRDSFESLVTQWNTYLTMQELVETAKETQDRVLALNRLGKATYEETADAQQSYEDAQMDALDALKSYNDMMNQARALATKRMVDEAEAMGADAVVNIRYASAAVMQGAAEVIAYGTAVKFIVK